MKGKSLSELKKIIDNPNDYVKEAIDAAKWELNKRIDNGDEITIDEHIRPNIITGEDKYRGFIKSIKPKSSFGFSLRYSESIQTAIEYKVISSLFAMAFEELDWDIVYHQTDQIEAKRPSSYNTWTEKIIVKINKTGQINITSESLDGSLWDVGRNSKRVKLLIHVFNIVLSEYDETKLQELVKEVEISETWADYIVPEKLPRPKVAKPPRLVFPIMASILATVILGFLLSLVMRYFHLVLLAESIIGLALTYILSASIKVGNYTNYLNLRAIMGVSVLLIVILGQYFIYLDYILDFPEQSFSFYQFIKFRFEVGFKLDNLNTGWIGLLILFILQLVIIYYVALMRLMSSLTSYQMSRVPPEVVDFVAYLLFIKEKDENTVRKELSSKGWVIRQDQDIVFEAIWAGYSHSELVRH